MAMSVDTRVTEALGEITSVIDAAEKNRAHGETLTKLSRTLARITDTDDDGAYTEAIRSVLGADRVEGYRTMIASAGSLAEAIQAVTVPATPEVTELANGLRNLTQWLDGELRDEVETALDRWDSLKPKRTMTGATSKPDLGFTVTVRCDEHGTVASTQKKNVNALRDSVRTHHGKEHGGKFSQGDEVFMELTRALKAVVEDGSSKARGGMYVVGR